MKFFNEITEEYNLSPHYNCMMFLIEPSCLLEYKVNKEKKTFRATT